MCVVKVFGGGSAWWGMVNVYGSEVCDGGCVCSRDACGGAMCGGTVVCGGAVVCGTGVPL